MDPEDWRSHLEAAHKHQEEIARTFPEVKVLLDHVASDVAQMLEKIETRRGLLGPGPTHPTLTPPRSHMRIESSSSEASF